MLAIEDVQAPHAVDGLHDRPHDAEDEGFHGGVASVEYEVGAELQEQDWDSHLRRGGGCCKGAIKTLMPCHATPCHAMPCHAMPCHGASVLHNVDTAETSEELEHSSGYETNIV
jgi:hypothetical protein